MPDPQRFAANIQVRAVQILRNAGRATAIATRAIGNTLAMDTPVATTLARSNWVASVGSGPDLSPRGFRSVGDVNSEIASKVANLEADSEVHIANGGQKVPYLGDLNNGTSADAPAGFVNAAVFDGVAAIQGARLLEG